MVFWYSKHIVENFKTNSSVKIVHVSKPYRKISIYINK